MWDAYDAAIWCLERAGSCCDCASVAVGLDDDTDATVWVAGGATGILYGREAIMPEQLQPLSMTKIATFARLGTGWGAPLVPLDAPEVGRRADLNRQSDGRLAFPQVAGLAQFGRLRGAPSGRPSRGGASRKSRDFRQVVVNWLQERPGWRVQSGACSCKSIGRIHPSHMAVGQSPAGRVAPLALLPPHAESPRVAA